MSCPRIVASNECSNLPPRTVPYDEYHFPNWYETLKSGNFDQNNDGFGFSNFRRSNREPTTLNESQLPSGHVDPDRMESNPEATIEVQRSEAKLFGTKYGDYQLFDDYYQCDTSDNYAYDQIVNREIAPNPLMKLFFSKRNVDHVIKLICKLVCQFCPQYKLTPEAQNKNELLAVFTTLYQEVPTNPYGDLEEELCRLNRAALDFMVPRTIVNIQSYLGYVRDHSTRRTTIPRPENVSLAGTRTNIMRPVC